MINNTNPYQLHIERAGSIAWRTLQQNAQGYVAAVFDKCFYINLDGRFICIGTSAFADGPLNVVSTAPALTLWSVSGVKKDDPVLLAGGKIRVGAQLTFKTASARKWSPPALPEKRFTRQYLEAARLFYLSQRPREGLAALVFEPAPSGRHFLAGAAEPLEELSGWLRTHLHSDAPPPAPVKNLLGLGPGLTPSGDDFIGAMLICLAALGWQHQQEHLARSVISNAAACTNPISQQHLLAATEGFGSSALHHLLHTLQSGTPANISSALTDLTAIGHTSGWDALAGLYVTLMICHDSERQQQVAA